MSHPGEAIKWLNAFHEIVHLEYQATGAFFDDTGVFYYAYLSGTVKHTLLTFYAHMKLEVQPSKMEHKLWAEFMEFLGLYTNTVNSTLELTVQKKTDYFAGILTVIEDASHSTRRRVKLRKVMRVEGRFNFCATTSCPAIKGDLSVLRSAINSCFSLSEGTRQTALNHNHVDVNTLWTTVSQSSCARLLLLGQRLRDVAGAAFFPRSGYLGKHNRHLMWTWSDASCDNNLVNATKFRGWGSVVWFRGTSTVFVMQELITWNARSKLQDSTAVELFALNETIAAMLPIIQRLKPDMIHIQDSYSSVNIVNRCRPHGIFERLLSQQRCSLLQHVPTQCQWTARHVTRDYIPDCDYLSKFIVFNNQGGPTQHYQGFYNLLCQRMGFAPSVIPVRVKRSSRDRINILVRAHDHADELPAISRINAANTFV